MREIAGIRIPDSKLAAAALDVVKAENADAFVAEA